VSRDGGGELPDGANPDVIACVTSMLHLRGAEKRKRVGRTRPKHNIQATVAPVGGPYSAWLEPHSKQPVAHEQLELRR